MIVKGEAVACGKVDANKRVGMKDNYNKTIRLQCAICGAEDFFETNMQTGVITCIKCNRVYNGGYDELVELNQKRIDNELELIGEEIQKDLSKDIQNFFRNCGFIVK